MGLRERLRREDRLGRFCRYGAALMGAMLLNFGFLGLLDRSSARAEDG